VQFQDFQARYLPAAVAAIEGSGSAGWPAAIAARVQAVANVWPVRDGGPVQVDTAFSDPAPETPPAAFAWRFRLRLDQDTANTLWLMWEGQDPADPAPANPWPTINGVSASGSGNERSYTLPAEDFAQPTLCWPNLSVVTTQEINATAQILRNDELANCPDSSQKGWSTNPALVYYSPSVAFADPVVPLLQVPEKITIANSTSVTDAVDKLMAAVIQPLTPSAQVGITLEAGYAFVLVTGSAQQGSLETELPVYLVKTTLTTEGTTPSPALQAFEAELIAALKKWYTDFNPSALTPLLHFKVTLFSSAGQQPLLRVLDVEAPISGPGWWAG
jgi:hypothetical protein